MNRRRWLSKNFIAKFIFIGGFGFIIIQGQWKQHLFRKFPRYTIGTTIRTYWTLSSGKQLEYVFQVNDRNYKSTVRFDDSSKETSGRYYVKYYANDPDISDLLQDQPVSDSIKFAPANGWDSIPN